MFWFLFIILTAVTVVSLLIDIEGALKYDAGGLSAQTVVFVGILTGAVISREIIAVLWLYYL